MAKNDHRLPPDFFAGMDDDSFEQLLRDSLATVQPPSDFSGRVMAAIQQETIQQQAAAAPARVIRFPLRRIFAGTGAAAAAILLFAAATVMPGDTTGISLAKPLQLAAEPIWQAPTAVPEVIPAAPPAATPRQEPPATAARPAQAAPAPAQVTTTPVQTTAPVEMDLPPEPTQRGELALPRAAYGTQTEGMLSTRMLASVAGSSIHTPDISSRNTSAAFQTVDGSNVYSWRVDLQDGSEPQIAIITELEPGATPDCPATTHPCDSTTIVESPDGMMWAQNADGADKGIWIAFKEGEVYRLTIEGGGNLLLWSNDSARLIFTNSEGQLFVGYPLEKRIYQITDLQVKDICLGSDNKTLLFIATEDGQDTLYTCQLL